MLMTEGEGSFVASTLYEAVLNESYFGKDDDLIKCEKYLDEIVQSMKDLKLPSNVANRERLSNVEEILKRKFNFSDVVLDTGAFTTGLAYTVPNYSILDYAYETETGAEGYRYKKAYFPCVIRVDKDLFSMAENGAEVLGVILHEIGHNFYYMPLLGRMVNTLFMIHTILYKYQMYLKNKIQFTILKPLKEFLESKVGFISDMYNFLETFFSWLSYRKDSYAFSKLFKLFLILIAPVNYAFNLVSSVIHGLVSLVLTGGTGYTNEKFADDFATAYGYGADMNKLLLRLHVPIDNDEVSFVQTCGEIGSTLLTLPQQAVGVHPSIGARISNAERRLKQEMGKTSNPKMKRIIQADLDKVIKAKKRFMELVKSKKILDTSGIDDYVKDPLLNRGKDAMEEMDRVHKGNDRSFISKMF